MFPAPTATRTGRTSCSRQWPESSGSASSRQTICWFAAASGDWNPIHVDPVSARRTLAGEVVVHGMFSLLWALDRHCATHPTPPDRVVAYFQRPIVPNEALSVARETTGDDVRLVVGAGTKASPASCSAAPGAGGGRGRPDAAVFRGKPAEHHVDALGGARGSWRSRRRKSDVSSERLRPGRRTPGADAGGRNHRVLAPSSAWTPGLHSLFTGLELRLDGPATAHLEWRVVRHSSPMAPLAIAVSGAGALSQDDCKRLSASTPSPSLRPRTSAGASHPALSRGDTRSWSVDKRGLGELTAKALAAGGAGCRGHLQEQRQGCGGRRRRHGDVGRKMPGAAG